MLISVMTNDKDIFHFKFQAVLIRMKTLGCGVPLNIWLESNIKCKHKNHDTDKLVEYYRKNMFYLINSEPNFWWILPVKKYVSTNLIHQSYHLFFGCMTDGAFEAEQSRIFPCWYPDEIYIEIMRSHQIVFLTLIAS